MFTISLAHDMRLLTFVGESPGWRAVDTAGEKKHVARSASGLDSLDQVSFLRLGETGIEAGRWAMIRRFGGNPSCQHWFHRIRVRDLRHAVPHAP